MKFFLAAAALLSAGVAFAQDTFTLNTPSNPVVCQPLLITWTGGTGPYFLSVHNGDDPSGPALVDLGQLPADQHQFTWTVNQQPNTRIGFAIRDSTGDTKQTAAVTVQSGSDLSCLNGGASSGSTSGGSTPTPGSSATGATTTPSATTTPATSTTTGPATTTALTTSATTSPGSSTSRSSATTSAGGSNTSSNAAYAPTQAAQIGAAGLVGAALMAILA